LFHGWCLSMQHFPPLLERHRPESIARRPGRVKAKLASLVSLRSSLDPPLSPSVLSGHLPMAPKKVVSLSRRKEPCRTKQPEIAYLQFKERGIPFCSIATYKRWYELHRQVRKVEKALALWMAVSRNLSKNARRPEFLSGGLANFHHDLVTWLLMASRTQRW
jgi:hypothetical protein